MVILFRLINADYFAALVLEPGVNIGKGRYMLRRAVTNLREEEFSS
jgi:predicted regulator of Ras-like GTPase activity (Roadblock/LC7/MglB family)